MSATASSAAGAPLVVVDGPLSHHHHVPGAVGCTRTQHVLYLPPALRPLLGRLGPGQRTPLFLTTTSWSRLSWYFKLETNGGPMDGIVRAEMSADLDVAAARRPPTWPPRRFDLPGTCRLLVAEEISD